MNWTGNWSIKVGIGLAFAFGFLTFAVKSMPTWLSWPGFAIGICLVVWGLLPNHDRLPILPVVITILSVAGAAFGVALLAPSLMQPQIAAKSQTPTADEIAAAVAEKTRLRDLFTRELDKPVRSVFVVLKLDKPMTPAELSGSAGVVQICSQEESKPCLYFGVRPDGQDWTVMPGNQTIRQPGFRSVIWTWPKQADKSTKASVIDDFLVFRYHTLDRLEAGAIMQTPFSTVDEFNNCGVLVRATDDLSNNLKSVIIVVNDFVVFDLARSDISSWTAPEGALPVAITQGTLDPNTGQFTNRRVVASSIVDPNFNMQEGFKTAAYRVAMVEPSRVWSAALDKFAGLRLADAPLRILSASSAGIGGHQAGSGTMTFPTGDGGWLPEDKGP